MIAASAPTVRINARRGIEDRLAPCLALPGEIWEVGVFQGHTSEVMAQAIATAPVRHHLRLFDSFRGRPEATPPDGRCSTTRFEDASRAKVEARVGRFPFVTIHEGWVPDTFAGLEEAAIAFAYVDLDLYAPTRDALAFIIPRVVPGGAVLVDDCGATAWPGIAAALRERPEGWTLVEEHRAWWRREA